MLMRFLSAKFARNQRDGASCMRQPGDRLLRFVVVVLVCVFTTTVAAGSSVPVGTKFHPGHYIFTEVSRSHQPDERNARRLEIIESLLEEPQLTGFVSHFEWKVLEPEKGQYDLSHIAEILDMLEGTGKYLGVYLRDRNFSKGCKNAPVPDYLLAKEYGKPYRARDSICMIELYNQRVVDRKLALYAAIAQAFDQHPNLEFITDGETTIPGGEDFSNDKWLEVLKYTFTESKKYFKNTMVLMQTNFLGTGTERMNALAEHMYRVGGGALGLPDTVPCRRTDNAPEDVCGYTIPGYDVLRHWKGKIAISPSASTWDLRYDDTGEVLQMAKDYLGADHVIWGRVFTSRVDLEHHGSDRYLRDEVFPTLREMPSVLHQQCPESLRPCISR